MHHGVQGFSVRILVQKTTVAVIQNACPEHGYKVASLLGEDLPSEGCSANGPLKRTCATTPMSARRLSEPPAPAR